MTGAGPSRHLPESLRLAGEYAEVVFANLPEGLLVLAPDLTILAANPNFLETFGLTLGALRGREFSAVIAADGVAERARAVLAGGFCRDELCCSMGAVGSGQQRPVKVTLVQTDPAGREARLVLFIEDRSEQARLQRALKESETIGCWTFASAFEYAAIGMALVAPDGRWLKVNRALCEVVGYSEAELSSQTFQDITHPDDLEADLRQVRRMLAGEIQSYQMEKRYFHKQGHVIWVLLSVSLVRNEGGEPLYFISQIQDISRRKEAEATRARLAAILEQTPDFVGTATPDGRVLYCNRSARRLLGIGGNEDVSNFKISDGHPEWASKIVLEEGIPTAMSEGTWEGETALLSRDGREIPVSQVILAHPGADGKIEYLSMIARDISGRIEAARRIEQLAYYDPLTGLPNRALFLDRLQLALTLTHRRGGRFAVLFVDLDRFKEINDTQGHEVGDWVLRELAQRLRSVLRHEETLARMGGDEFVVLVLDVDQVGAAKVAERIRTALAEPLVGQDQTFGVQASIGIAMYPDDGVLPGSLLKHADLAMYRAKAEGGGFRFYHPEMSAQLMRRLELARRLDRVLAQGQLKLFYQPQVELVGGRLVGAEILLRWRDPEWGWISPAEFIPIAEERGMTGRLGEFVLEKVCSQIRAWREGGLTLPKRFALNVAASQLLDPHFAPRIDAILEREGIAAGCLELEITESTMMAEPEWALEVMRTLRERGFSFAIDDFGTGYSSLSYLKRFPVEVLKIDGSFVREMLSDRSDHAIVQTIIAMAHSLDLRTVAEGVENPAQAERLLALGCDRAQGYYFGRPKDANAFARRWLVCAPSAFGS
jgi:diguanylate cyclase (GGDEF)-like protein/PAS domain S-box-containing protein